MKFFIILLAGLLPTYIVRFSLLGIPTNFFEISVWIVAFSTVLSRIAQKQAGKISGGKTLGVNAETPSVEEPVIFTFIALFLLSAVISTIISPNIWHSLGILKGWVITPIIF